MKNENEKIAALKAKYQDKSLSRNERQQIMQELVRERYKIDKRKPISQRAMAKRNMLAGLIAVLAGAGYFAVEAFGISGTNSEIAVISVIAVTVIGLFSWMIIPMVGHKPEPDDEFSKHNKLKAGSIAVELMGSTGVAACFIASAAFPETITIKSSALMFIMYIVIGLYCFTYYAAFLKLEGKPDHESEDE